MKRIWIGWSGFLLLTALFNLNCSCDSPSDPTPPAITVKWDLPDELHNVQLPPITLEVSGMYGFTPTRVLFLADSVEIGWVEQSPFTLTWDDENAVPGFHDLEAVAYGTEEQPLANATLRILIPDLDGFYAGTYGGSNGDTAHSLELLTGGSIALAGDFTLPGGELRGFLLHLDEATGERWFRSLGDHESHLRAATQADDGSLVLAGWTWTATDRGDGDQWLIKIASDGNVVWSRGFDIAPGSTDFVHDIQQTPDGGYVLAGQSDSGGAFVQRTNASGSPQWSSTLGGMSTGYSLRRTPDGGYVLTGLLTEGDYARLLLAKLNDGGAIEWQRTLGDGGPFSVGRCVRVADDGGYVITGGTNSDLWLLKTDPNGGEEWSHSYGGIGWDLGLAVEPTSDGGYIVVGQTTPGGAEEPDLFLLKTDSAGNEEWSRSYGGEQRDAGYAVRQTATGGYFVAGHSESFGAGATDVWLFEVDAQGNPLRATTGGKRQAGLLALQ